MQRQHLSDCAAYIETRTESEFVRQIVQDIADQFGLPLELLRLSDRFGQELYLPSKYLRRDAEDQIFELIILLREEHDMLPPETPLPDSLNGLSVKQVIDIISPEW